MLQGPKRRWALRCCRTFLKLSAAVYAGADNTVSALGNFRRVPKTLPIQTAGRGLIDITSEAAAYLNDIGAESGLLNLFVQHTSASLTIQENADPDVLADLTDHLARLAPQDAPWRHTAEGPDDMPAHVKTALTDTSLMVPVINGAMALGAWQGIYLFEHRDRPHQRRVVMTFMRTE